MLRTSLSLSQAVDRAGGVLLPQAVGRHRPRQLIEGGVLVEQTSAHAWLGLPIPGGVQQEAEQPGEVAAAGQRVHLHRHAVQQPGSGALRLHTPRSEQVRDDDGHLEDAGCDVEQPGVGAQPHLVGGGGTWCT